jgi:hypothetical protein
VTLCLSNYGDKCCKLYVLMFGLWLFSRFTPPLNAATFWINYVTSRQCITVDGKLVTIIK